MLEQKVKNTIRDVPDFPKPGILFKDITPVFQNPILCDEITTHLANTFRSQKIDIVAGIESRGFLFGFTLAQKLGVPFVLIRKAGKLPYKKISQSYDLEYGSATIEMHIDAIQKGQRVLIHDDLLATGGTAEAAAQLIQKQEGILVGFAFVIELSFLEGRKMLDKYNTEVWSLVTY